MVACTQQQCVNLVLIMFASFPVIVDAVLITVLLCKNVMFSMLVFPTVFFVNVCSYAGCDSPRYIRMHNYAV